MDSARDAQRARRHELDPVGPGRHHLDGHLRRCRLRQHIRDDLENRRRRKRLGDVPVGLPAHRPQQRVGRVVGGHHHDARRLGERADFVQDIEAAHAGQPHVQQDDVERAGGQLGQRGWPIGGLGDPVAGLFEQSGNRVAQAAVVVHDKNARLNGRAGTHDEMA